MKCDDANKWLKMECSITGHDGLDGLDGHVLKKKLSKASKAHTCGECGSIIRKGQEYELYQGVYDGEIHTEKTCVDCCTLRDAFFGNSVFMFGSVRGEITEHILYNLNGDVSHKCIVPLSEKAKEFVFELIETAWEYCDD